jgi:serine/threonine protein kinase
MMEIENEKRLWDGDFKGVRMHQRQRMIQNNYIPSSRSLSGGSGSSGSDDDSNGSNRSVTLRDLYSLRQVLSDTSNGTVFSGRRRRDGRPVAIKRIMRTKVKRWGIVRDRQVPMEVALLRKVNEKRHSGIVEVLEWFECADCFLVVMARPTPVMDLFDYVSKRKRLNESEAKKILEQIIDSLEHCAQRNVFHRDVKLENILVVPTTLQTTLIDFGCGSFYKDTCFTDFAGTPQYYPPEWFLTRKYNGYRQTIWSCGVLLYSLITGNFILARIVI